MVGLAIGASAGLTTLCERVYLGWMPAWYEWLALPVGGALVGFVSGFVVAGPMPVEGNGRVRTDRRRGIATRRRSRSRSIFPLHAVGTDFALEYPSGSASGTGLSFLLVQFMTPVYRGNMGMVNVIAHKAELPLLCFALFAAGVAAGSGTKTGFSQGLLTGLLILGLLYLFKYGNPEDFWLRVALPSLTAPTLGGMLGRKIFPPSRVFREGAQPRQRRPAKA